MRYARAVEHELVTSPVRLTTISVYERISPGFRTSSAYPDMLARYAASRSVLSVWQLIAELKVCLLMNTTLSSTELGNCTKFGSRAYNTFLTGINGVSSITGSNGERSFSGFSK